MLEQILSRANLLKAWQRVKANGGAAGVDGITIEDFPAYLQKYWSEIKRQLLEDTYLPAPVKRVEIPKRSGGKRPLGIPIVLDRLIQQAILQVLQPISDPGFSRWSFGFRPFRSAHGAARHVRQTIDSGFRFVVDVDLSKFFDRVNHDLLMARLARKIKDKRVLRLIGRYLRAGVYVDGKVFPTTEGVPQGGPLSPLLANVMLDDFDKELEKRGHRFARYADDFVILVKSKRAAERVFASVSKFLERKLKLVINQEKSKIVGANESEYLGFVFKGKRIIWSDESLENFRYNIRRLTARSWGISMDDRLERLSSYIRGWMGYYALSEYYRPLPELDEWIRRRVRMCYIKQWRRCRTRIRNLLNLGAVEKQAIAVGMSSKGPWKLARTYGSQSGLTNAFLKEQDLVSVRDLWIAFHYPK
ncbi:group II intron reverse transcriptase/maturase [candidate division KSB1 bacterium RBG_16_48_16]|nr:MAG: group II intron reverse transcriptase/maturase [candidate division KSB1 bacterium RBG_16_48_16]